jgi:serine/threonine protein kinase/tetratricopeptide (TPR) repeat protein
MGVDRELGETANIPVGLSEALAFYDSLTERVGQSPEVSTRDEARRQALDKHPMWVAQLRNHFRLEDCMLGITTASYVSGTVICQRYKLLEEIAEGGMGTVWLAEQTHPVRRRVAVKLIKPGMDSRQVLARFEAERQALAVMDHPHIAKVLDGGVTEQGRPYFVMEYVKGVPITHYCDQAKLNVAQRLKLMTQVCQAVQHAHQKGIIHRDLKPSNILVCLYDGQPVPKVIDFGLAKALHQPLTEGTVFTSHGLMVGTPLYMSPEQAEFNNLDIDTRSDVYSLGVILYELLTGSTPLDKQRFKDAAIQEIVRLIKEEEPSKPSTKLSGSGQLPSIAAQRSLDPAQLSKVMRGDLDWIVMKSLDKERSRRYETANGLAKDIERYLTDLPVEACPPSTAYKFRKFARRNRLMLGAIGGITAALILGIGVSSWLAIKAMRSEEDAELARINAEKDRDEAVRQTGIANEARLREQAALILAEQRLADAERERDTAQQQSQLALSTLTRIIEDMQEGLADLPGSGEVRRRLLATSLEKLEEVATEYVEQTAVDRNAMQALMAMGEVILQVGIGEEADALMHSTAVHSHEGLTGEFEAAALLAEQFFMRAHDIARDLVANNPGNVQGQLDLSRSYSQLGIVQLRLGDTQSARDYLTQSHDLISQLAAEDPGNIQTQYYLAHAIEGLAFVYLQLDEIQTALAFSQEYHEVSLRLAADDPNSTHAQRALRQSYTRLADVHYRMEDSQTALGYYQKALEFDERFAEANPHSVETLRSLSATYVWIATMYLELGDVQSALVYFHKNREINERRVADEPSNVQTQRDLATSYSLLTQVSLQMSEPQSALEFQQENLEINQRLAAADPNSGQLQRDLSSSLGYLGIIHVELNDHEAAIDCFSRAVEILDEVIDSGLDVPGAVRDRSFWQSHLQTSERESS